MEYLPDPIERGEARLRESDLEENRTALDNLCVNAAEEIERLRLNCLNKDEQIKDQKAEIERLRKEVQTLTKQRDHYMEKLNREIDRRMTF